MEDVLKQPQVEQLKARLNGLICNVSSDQNRMNHACIIAITPDNALLKPYKALSAICAACFRLQQVVDWLPFTDFMGFTPKMLSRPAHAPVASSLIDPLVSQCPVRLILSSVRWGISDGIDRQHNPRKERSKVKGASEP